MQNVVEHAKRIITSPLALNWMRLGFVVRGVLYCMVGIGGLLFAWRIMGSTITAQTILTDIARWQYGTFVLSFIATGLAGYTLWGVVRIIFVKNIGKKLGYVMSIVAYGSLAWGSLKLLWSYPTLTKDTSLQHASSQILSVHYGQELLILVGIITIIASTYQAIKTLKTNNVLDFWGDGDLLAKKTIRRTFLYAAKIGIAVRSVVFLLMGVFTLFAGYHLDPQQVMNIDDILHYVRSIQGGSVWLSIISSGLIIFGLYSLSLAFFVNFIFKDYVPTTHVTSKRN